MKLKYSVWFKYCRWKVKFIIKKKRPRAEEKKLKFLNQIKTG